MKIHCQFLAVLIVLFSLSCKEPYTPIIDEPEKLMVVDGLLSDESNIITVHLNYTASFKEADYLPVIGAIVTVTDDEGRKFDFIERPPGTYKSKAFSYEYGRSYVLNILTKNNKKYKSSAQKLYPKAVLEPVTAVVKSKSLQTVDNNIIVTNTLNGLEFNTMIKKSIENSGYFRFSNIVLVEYIEQNIYTSNPDSLPGFFYSWKKYYPNETFNLNDTKFSDLSENQHKLAFCPIDTTFYTIIQKAVRDEKEPMVIKYINTRNLYYFAITVKEHQINEDVHQYYKEINAQLEAKNRIFDPISFQVRGNITCVDDPLQPVLGVFEVSSTSMRTYTFSDFLPDKSVIFGEIDTLEMNNIPNSGSLYDKYPSFWIYNY